MHEPPRIETKSTDNRLFLTIFFILIGLHLLLICTQRLYPFTDLPNHLAAATISRYYDDPSNRFAEFYALDRFLKPNVFHQWFCSLPPFPSVEAANRFFLCLYVLLLPLAVLILIEHLGGNRWYAFLSFLLLYNYNASWGFVGFIFALPLILFLLRLSAGHIDRPTSGHGFAVAVLLVALFFVHALAALFSVLLYIVCLFTTRRLTPKGKVFRIAAAIPSLVLLNVWWNSDVAGHGGSPMVSDLGAYYTRYFIGSIPERYTFLFLDNYLVREGGAGIAVGLFFSFCIIVPFLYLSIRRVIIREIKDGVDVRPALALFATSLVCYLILPSDIPGQTVLYQRFSVLLLLSIITVGACLARSTPNRLAQITLNRITKIGLIIVCIAHFVLWADNFIFFNRENRAFNRELLREVRDSGTLAGLVFDYRYRGNPAYIHFPNYYIVWRRGIACTKIVDYRFGTVRRRVGIDALPHYLEWVVRYDDYDGTYMKLDYLLVRGTPTEKARRLLEGFRPAAEAGKWTLYENSGVGSGL
jgi:hypothetical protein